ncbi:MAG: CoB--CoM heterodisulfide reductase iron-sulfur subunit B family protein [Syntrophobacterales bacterium]|nr:CoB--CoM heterodisulfide reductase iron-sulfur subunit B family protein [Syntrophobacterales bacterium]
MKDNFSRTVAYYPGCSVEGTAKEFDESTREIFRVLNVALREIPDWNCCGSTPSHIYDPLLSAAISGRNLAIAERMGFYEVMTPCPGCLKALKGSIEVFNNPLKRKDLLNILDMPFYGRIKAVSVVQFLVEDVGIEEIERCVLFPLEGITIVPYYGCLLTRPPKSAQFDDPEQPTSLDRILEAIGATVPHFPFKTECCGATYGVVRKDIVGRLTGRILEMALDLGADAIAVACPLCQQNLDLRQEQIERYRGRSFKISVPYITQLIGLSFGIDPKKLGWHRLAADPQKLLTRFDKLSKKRPTEPPTIR